MINTVVDVCYFVNAVAASYILLSLLFEYTVFVGGNIGTVSVLLGTVISFQIASIGDYDIRIG